MARGPGRPAWNHKALVSSRVERGKHAPPSSGGDALGSLWLRGNPADASGAVRPDPRASTKVVRTLFQTAKLLHQKFDKNSLTPYNTPRIIRR